MGLSGIWKSCQPTNALPQSQGVRPRFERLTYHLRFCLAVGSTHRTWQDENEYLQANSTRLALFGRIRVVHWQCHAPSNSLPNVRRCDL